VKLEESEGAWRVTIVARDRPFLFASFAGALTSFGLDILKAEAFANSRGIILDTFVVADTRRMIAQNPGETERLSDLLQRLALGKTDVLRLMRGRNHGESKKNVRPPEVQFDSDACDTATLVEINTEDRPGLLFSLASAISSANCNIDVVLIDTKGHRAIDVFYVAHEGRKLAVDVQDRLKQSLLAAC
jgi:[protein-PII] uridylyltransferase